MSARRGAPPMLEPRSATLHVGSNIDLRKLLVFTNFICPKILTGSRNYSAGKIRVAVLQLRSRLQVMYH